LRQNDNNHWKKNNFSRSSNVSVSSDNGMNREEHSMSHVRFKLHYYTTYRELDRANEV